MASLFTGKEILGAYMFSGWRECELVQLKDMNAHICMHCIYTLTHSNRYTYVQGHTHTHTHTHTFSTDISTKASLLPPKVAVAKYVLLSPAQAEQLFTDASHVVFSQPRDMKYTVKV